MSALVTDHDRLAAMQICLERQLTQHAVFELVVRTLPPKRNFLVAAGLEQALQFLKSLSFSEAEFAWLRQQGGFSPQLLDYAHGLRFDGDVDAMPEGTVFFAGEPIIRITAPLPVAQLIESRLLNLVHFETAIASSAARIVLAARGRRLLDLGLRRAHGSEAALLAARAAYLAGFDGSATMEASRRFGIPTLDTLFLRADATGVGTLFSIPPGSAASMLPPFDATDLLTASSDPVDVAGAMRRRGIAIKGVQLEGADLVARARTLRARLDAAGLADLAIRASGDLDEMCIGALATDGVPIDEFGVGGWLLNESEATRICASCEMSSYAAAAPVPADEETLLRPCMRGGKRIGRTPTLAESRRYLAEQLDRLPGVLRALEATPGAMRVARDPGSIHFLPSIQTGNRPR
jgi:nicotinate phosphoribosyltransferase